MVRLRELFCHLLPFVLSSFEPNLNGNRGVCGPIGAPLAITGTPKESPHVQMSSTMMIFMIEYRKEKKMQYSHEVLYLFDGMVLVRKGRILFLSSTKHCTHHETFIRRIQLFSASEPTQSARVFPHHCLGKTMLDLGMTDHFCSGMLYWCT